MIGTTYDSTLSRVRISCSGAPTDADYALIERSTDQINWTVVRGGVATALSAGACQLDDYEFEANATNYYRATYVDSSAVSFVAEGTLSMAVNANVTPGLPVGVQDGDVLVLAASIRNTAGAPNTPAGWAVTADNGNYKIFTRVYAAGVVAPTVSFTGGVAGADTIGRMRAYRNADYNVLSSVQTNASQQDVPFPAVAVSDIKPNMIDMSYWKQSDMTSSSNGTWTLTSRSSSTAGDDATMGSWRMSTSVNTVAGSVSAVGGSAAISKVAMLRFTRKAFLAQETTSIAPEIAQVWLKDIQRPFLNRTIVLVGQSEVQRPSRSGLFDIKGRSDAIAVTELRASPRFSIRVKTETADEYDSMDLFLDSGSVVFIQTPPGCPRPLKTGYYLIQSTSADRAQSIRSPRRYFDLPLIRCAAPNPTMVGNSVTWQGVVNAFATWSDLIAAEPTWADVLERVDAPGDVVVP